MSGTLKALLRILLFVASASIPYYFRFVLGMEVTLADFLYAPVILAVMWWPRIGILIALSLGLLLTGSHLVIEQTTPLLHDLQRALTLWAIALVTTALSGEAKETEREIRQHNQELSALNAIASTTSQFLDLDEILEVTFGKVLETMGAELGGIYLLDEGGGNLIAKVYRGVSPEFVEEAMKLDDSPAGRVLRSGEPMLMEDLSERSELTRIAVKRERLQSYVSVPLKSKEKVLGIMDVITRRPHWLTRPDVELLTSIGNHIGVTVENARLFEQAQKEIGERKRAEEELQRSLEILRTALEGTVRALASAVETRDRYTAGHQRRVAQLACAIANEMDLPKQHIEGIRMAAVIHDIGKINVPAELLSKPGELSGIEHALIATHAQVGYGILNGTIEFPWPVAQIVLQHHERMDGSGYPQGLSGEDILLEARILGVADVVEAMASRRPYRSARGMDKALKEISQNRAALYDPGVVDTCLKLFIEKGFEFE